MGKKRSILNVGVSVFFRFFMIIGALIVRRVLIQYVGNEVNGLDSLYTSLIGFLSVTELGVGNAITFCMYRPIVERNDKQVAALYQLFTKTYRIIGLIMLLAGVALIPVLPYLAKDYAMLDVDFGFTFLLMLVSVVISYIFSAKSSLVNAYRNNYIITAISSVGMILQFLLQIIVVMITHSFTLYLVCRIVAMLFQWVLTEIYVNRNHKDIICHGKELVAPELKREIINKVKALFMHRVGGILVNTSDSMIISAFIGVVVLGKYSNYSVIADQMSTVISLFFSPLTSTIGHVFVRQKESMERYYQRFYLLNFILGVVFFLGYYAVIDNLVAILFGSALKINKTVSFVIALNYFVQYMRRATVVFKDATGTFYNDRWKPVFEGIMNIVLSIWFVKLFGKIGGEEYAMVGVIAATIITNLLICHIVEPYVLYKYAFEKAVTKHLVKNYFYIALFILALLATNALMQNHSSEWVELIINGGLSILISLIVVVLTVSLDKNARTEIYNILKRKQVK